MTDVPRVFISSVMSGFEPYRAAARQGVIDAHMKPVLIEDFPSLDMSSRSACLDLVQSSDVYVVIIGERAGSSPLGKPVVEEEFEEARRRKLPRLMFLQNVARDDDTDALATRLSDFVHGRFRATFQTPDDLRAAVAKGLRALETMRIDTNDPGVIQELLQAGREERNTSIRIVVVPERKDDVFDLLEFDRPEFRRSLLKAAHRDDVQLLDFEQGQKTTKLDGRDLIVEQEPRRGNPPEIGVTIRVREDGSVVIDQTLSDRARDHHQLSAGFQILESDIAQAVRSALAFIDALYEQYDPGHRYSTFLFATAVAGLGMHVVVGERRDQRSWSFPNYGDRGWVVLDKLRRVDRTDLTNSKEIIDRTLAVVVKRYGERK